jgi:hypothetical protein
MTAEIEHSLDCLACDFGIHPNWDAYMRVVAPAPAWIHTSCRAPYERQHGPVVCEEDRDGDGLAAFNDRPAEEHHCWICKRLVDGCDCGSASDPEVAGLRRQEDAIERAGDFSSVTVGDEALEVVRARAKGGR